MFSLSSLLRTFLYPEPYIWADVFLLKETQKAILIMFDGRKAWIPKAWILRIKRNRHYGPQKGKVISIKISEYHWAKKFW